MAATEPGPGPEPGDRGPSADLPAPPPVTPPPVAFSHASGGSPLFSNVGPGRYIPTAVRRKLFQGMMRANSQPQLFDLNVQPDYMSAFSQGGW